MELERRIDILEQHDIEHANQIEALKEAIKANGDADIKRWKKTVKFVKTGSKVVAIAFIVLLVLIGMFPALADKLIEFVPVIM